MEGKAQGIPGMMTVRQRKFIDGLLTELEWTDDSGAVDEERFRGFVRERFKVHEIKWITTKIASQIIEALKKMAARERKEAI